MTITYYLKPIKGKNRSKIYCRIVYNRKKAEISTGISCLTSSWDDKKEEIKGNSYVNQKLSELRMKIYKAKNTLDDSERRYSVKDIKNLVIGPKKSKESLLIYFEKFIEQRIENDSWSKATRKLYFTSYRYISDFLTSRGEDNLLMEEFTPEHVAEFDNYLHSASWNQKGERLSTTTRNKHHTRIKCVLNDAWYKGKITSNPYTGFRLSFPQGKREYLTNEELERIKELDLKKDRSLEMSRDLFLFSCYTGLRFGDAIGLKKENIISVNGEMYIKLDQIKTDERREIPLLDQAKEIIQKYMFDDFRMVHQKILPQLTNQKVNRDLKIIAFMIQLKKPLTHHIARHTCATTILLDNSVPIEVASHWLGHTNIKTTQIYAKISHNKLQNESSRLNEILNS